MVFNFADDSRNLVFRKGSSSVDYNQEYYTLAFVSQYSNKYLTNVTPNPFYVYDGDTLFINLTKVDDNDQYISFSWDRDDYDGFGTALPSEYGKDDITGYYTLELYGSSVTTMGRFAKPILTTTCKVINDWKDSIIYDVNKGTREQEDGGEYIYYRQ